MHPYWYACRTYVITLPPPNAKNAFAFSKLAVCIAFLFASAGNVAYADTSITIKDNSPIDSAEELQEFNQQLSATDQNKVVIVENSTAIVFRPDMDKVEGTGNLTFEINSTDPENNGGTIIRGLENAENLVSFEGFDNLIFNGKEENKVSTIIADNGGIAFGSEEKALQNLTFNKTVLDAWKSSFTADVYAQNLSMSETLQASKSDWTIHSVEGNGTRDFQNGIHALNGHNVTVNGGTVSVGTIGEGPHSILVNGQSTVSLGETTALDSFVTEGGINVAGAGKVTIGTSGQLDENGNPVSTIGGSVYVGKDGTFNWLSGSVTVDGNVRGDGGFVGFGNQTNGTKLEKLVVNGTDPNLEDVYPNGIHLTGGSYIAAKDFELKGAYNIQNSGDKTNVLQGENATFTAYDGQIALSIQNGSLTIQETGSLTINGTAKNAVNLNGGTLTATGKDISINGSVGMTNNSSLTLGDKNTDTLNIVANADQESATMLGVGGGSVTLTGGTVKISAGENYDDTHTALSVGGAGTIVTVNAGSLDVDGRVILNGNTKTTLNASQQDLTVTGYVNNSGNLTLRSENGTVKIDTPESATYHYYTGLRSSGTTEVTAKNFTVNGRLEVTAGTTTVTATESHFNAKDRAISLSGGAELTFKDAQDANQIITVGASGLLASGTATKMTVEAGSFVSDGVVQANGANLSLGDDSHRLKNVTFQLGGTGAALRSNGGTVNVYGETINLLNEGGVALDAFTYQREGESDQGNLTLNASSALNIRGDIIAGKDSGFLDEASVRENSTVKLQSSGTTTIIGNLRTYNDDEYLTGNSLENENPGTVEKGETKNVIELALNGEGSFLQGNVVDEGASAQDGTGTALTITDGARWTNTADSTVTNLTVDGGVVDATGGNITAEVFDGEADVILKGEVGEDGSIETTSFTVKDADAESYVDVHYKGITSDDVVGQTLDGVDGVAATSHVDGGDLYDDWVQVTDAEGKVVSTSYEVSEKLESFRGITAASLVQWRDQVNHLTKRLGDVRSQSGDIGAWARVYGGEYKWGEAARVDMQTTTVQVGGDARLGDWIVGGAFSYSDSSSDLDRGSADGELFGLAVYGSKLFENGVYLDLVARYGHIKNDISVENMDVETKSNAFGLSAEVGHQFRFLEAAYVEPQFEVSYGFVEGDTSKASNGVKIDQDDYQNLITRIGVRSGFDFPKEAGTIYAHVSYSYDFLGDADAKAMKSSSVPVSLDEDLGGGWVTYGIGGQFRLGKSSYAFGELERSTGGDVENPWAFNVGYRYLF